MNFKSMTKEEFIKEYNDQLENAEPQNVVELEQAEKLLSKLFHLRFRKDNQIRMINNKGQVELV